jgi:hypothetical protein
MGMAVRLVVCTVISEAGAVAERSVNRRLRAWHMEGRASICSRRREIRRQQAGSYRYPPPIPTRLLFSPNTIFPIHAIWQPKLPAAVTPEMLLSKCVCHFEAIACYMY